MKGRLQPDAICVLMVLGVNLGFALLLWVVLK